MGNDEDILAAIQQQEDREVIIHNGERHQAQVAKTNNNHVSEDENFRRGPPRDSQNRWTN